MCYKVLYANPASNVSGAEKSLSLLIHGIDKSVFKPTVLIPQYGKLTEELDGSGAEIEYFPMKPFMLERNVVGSSFDSILALRQLAPVVDILKKHSPDIIHINSYRIGVVFSLAARLVGIPCLWHIRDIPNSRLKCRFVGQLTRFPEQVITISNAVTNALGIEGQSNVKVVYNGLALQQFNNLDGTDFRRELKISDGTFLVGMVGQLISRKGHSLLIEALKHSDYLKNNLHLVIVGGTVVPIGTSDKYEQKYYEELKEKIVAYHLEKNITLTGHREDVPQVLAALDLLVHAATEPEPFGRVLIESMAAGTPVLASNWGGIPEIIQSADNGLLFTPCSVKDLSKQLEFAVHNPSKLKTIAKNGKLIVRQQFDIVQHVMSIQQIYHQVLHNYQ